MLSILGQAFRTFSGVTEIVLLVTGQQLFTFRKCCLDLRDFLYVPIILVKWPPDCVTISYNCSYVCGDYILFLKSYRRGDKVRQLVTQAAQEKEF